MRNLVLIFCLVSTSVWGASLPLRKQFSITKSIIVPKIDATPNDKAWEQVSPITDFIQQSPINGGIPSQKTEVKMLYDDNAVYVLAMLFDTKPDSIYSELGDRDSGADANADVFSIEINPYNDGLNSLEFMVSAAGVQMESKNDLNTMYKSWDAVWKSAVKKTGQGWVVEMEIPFSAIRFPKKEIQLWEINFFRLIKRNGESITWNFVDKNKFGWLNQAGEMHGMHGINPPLRLSLMPYFSTYYNKGDFSFKGGLDLKYGLNESFTLDMMLIPDFGQTRADDAVLNLTSVETKYDEKRQFFTEGTELFNKGDLFYSRRIGGQPRNYDKVYSLLAANETVRLNPSETNLYNATKISGHTSSGWGLGFLNAVTKQQTAQIKDTITGQVRNIVTQGVSNYNLLVLDKVIGKESYISWTNANVTIPDENHLSNVSGMEFKYNLKNFQISGDAVLSYLRDKPETTVTNQFGHRFNLNFGKTTGAFRYEMYNTLLSKTYNPWDFGYLENNNLISNVLKFQYLRFKPTRHFNDITTELNLNYESLYKPLLYGRFEIDGNIKFLFKSYNYLKFFISATPVEKYDYYEPRVEGWKYKEPTAAYGGAEFSLDARRRFSFWVNIGYWHASKFDKSSAYLAFQPHYRVNDRLSFDYLLNLVHQQNSIGYVAKNTGNDSIYFGRRGILSIENVGTVKLSLSNKSSLNFRLRHYWSNVEYANYYLLQHSGDMQDIELNDNYNVNYCLLNSDMSYTWQFLPGSELSIVWKNYYSTSNRDTKRGFYSSLKNVFSYSQINSISFKVIYYIDYQTIKKRF